MKSSKLISNFPYFQQINQYWTQARDECEKRSSKPLTCEIWIEETIPQDYKTKKLQLLEWRQQNNSQIQYSFPTFSRRRERVLNGKRARRVAVVLGKSWILKSLPSGVSHKIINPLNPMLVLAADAWNESYDLNGERISGTKHFAPGQTVYFHGIYSGDGYSRVYATGRHRHDGQICQLMCNTERFVNWRAEIIQEPILVYHLQHAYRWEEGTQPYLETMANIMNNRVMKRKQNLEQSS